MQPEEEVLLSIRRNPKAVRLEWAKGPSKGREVIYSAAINDRMMYVNSGNSALPLPRMSIPVDSPLALRNSRHPITEAGFDTILDNLFRFLEPKTAAAASDGKLVYKGIDRPKGLDQPCHLVERVTPKGETWQVYLDTRTYMPAMVVGRPDLQRRADRTIHIPQPETKSRRSRFRRGLRSRQALGRVKGLAVTDRPSTGHADGRQFPTDNDALTAKVTHKRAIVTGLQNRPISRCCTLTTGLAMSCSDRLKWKGQLVGYSARGLHRNSYRITVVRDA